jgi:hypothetical protein
MDYGEALAILRHKHSRWQDRNEAAMFIMGRAYETDDAPAIIYDLLDMVVTAPGYLVDAEGDDWRGECLYCGWNRLFSDKDDAHAVTRRHVNDNCMTTITKDQINA